MSGSARHSSYRLACVVPYHLERQVMFLVQFLDKIYNEFPGLYFDFIFRFRWFHFWILRLWILWCRWCDCENLVQICHDHEYVSSVGETRPRGTCAHGANGVAIVRCILTQRRDLTSAIKPCVIRKSDQPIQLQLIFYPQEFHISGSICYKVTLW